LYLLEIAEVVFLLGLIEFLKSRMSLLEILRSSSNARRRGDESDEKNAIRSRLEILRRFRDKVEIEFQFGNGQLVNYEVRRGAEIGCPPVSAALATSCAQLARLTLTWK
jgi:hypothetical protein